MLRRIISGVVLLFFCVSCHETTSLDKCNPSMGRFINGQHFVPDEFLNEEKKWDYKSWYRYFREHPSGYSESGCIPLKTNKTLEQIIEEEEETIDLIR